jgi:hypothetical protein
VAGWSRTAIGSLQFVLCTRLEAPLCFGKWFIFLCACSGNNKDWAIAQLCRTQYPPDHLPRGLPSASSLVFVSDFLFPSTYGSGFVEFAVCHYWFFFLTTRKSHFRIWNEAFLSYFKILTLIVTQLVKKFPYGTWRFITVFIKPSAGPCPEPYAYSSHFFPTYFPMIRPNIISPSASVSSNWSLLFKFLEKRNCKHLSYLPCMLHVSPQYSFMIWSP